MAIRSRQTNDRKDEAMSERVREHIERCIELYGQPGDDDEWLRAAKISRSSYEQMRADLMLAVGMLMAVTWEPTREQPKRPPFYAAPHQ